MANPHFTNPIPGISVALNDAGTVMTFNDTTGLYDATVNPNGWGAPGGMDIACANRAIITITDPDGVNTTINAHGSAWPDTTGNINIYHYVIPAGEDEPSQFADGVYKISYDVYSTLGGLCSIAPDTQYLQLGLTTVFVYTKLKECVDKKMLELSSSDCNCDRDKLNQLLYLNLIYQAFLAAACCGNTTRAQYLYDRALKICNKNLCVSC